MLNYSCDKIRACNVVCEGERSPPYDPGSELCYWEGESSSSITINGMGKRKEVTCITAAVVIRYPSKLDRSTRSGLTAVALDYYAIGPRTTSLTTRSGHGRSPYWPRMLEQVKIS